MHHGGNVWQGGDPAQWLDFSANIRPGGPPDWVIMAMRQGLEDVAYYPDPAMSAAKQGLADYLGLADACVQPASGGISALNMALGLGWRQVAVIAPCFTEYAYLAELHDVPVTHATLDALPARFAAGSLVCLCNPNNPTGRAMSHNEVMALYRRIATDGAYLLVDEAFGAYCPECSAVNAVMAQDHLLVAGSLTKILGVPGVRLGYLCANPTLLEQARRYQLPWELNCAASAVARALPDHKSDLLQEARRNEERRQNLAAGLAKLGFLVYPSRASFLLAKTPHSASALAESLRLRHILVRTCMDFWGLDDDHHLRLAVKNEFDHDRLLKALASEYSAG